MSDQPFDIQVRWRELGRVRMGDKGPKGEPRKLTKWRLTSAGRALLEAAAKLYGGEVKEWTDGPDKGLYELFTEADELDILLPPSINQHGAPSVSYSRYYELWSGGGCKRRCDGTTELISGDPCVCDPEKRECKVTLRTQFMLPRVPSVGVWRLESHGYNAAAELPGTLNLLAAAAARGQFVPAVLRIESRSQKKIVDGKALTRRFIVPVIDLPGITLADAAPALMTFNAPALPPAGKPALGEGAALPADPSFEKTPDLGAPPPLPTNGKSQSSTTDDQSGSSDGGLFPDGDTKDSSGKSDVDKLRGKIFAQFSQLKIGTAERKTLVRNRYGLDSFADLDLDQMSDLSKWLNGAQPDELTAAMKADA